MEIRNENIKQKKNMMIDMDPELAAAFAASTKVSSKWLIKCFQLFNFLMSNEQGIRFKFV